MLNHTKVNFASFVNSGGHLTPIDTTLVGVLYFWFMTDFAKGLEGIGRHAGDAIRAEQTPVGATLNEFGNWFLQQTTTTLEREGVNASFDLLQSLSFTITLFGRKTLFQFFMAEHGEFIDEGVDGTQQSQGSPFRFRNDIPSRAQVSALRQWIPFKGIQLKKPRPGIPLDKQYRSLAYAIAVSTKRKGIKRTGFITDTLTPGIIEVLVNDLSEAAGRDVEVQVEQMVARVNAK